ncbi:MAG: STAS domain-containing protein [Blastocatellia bacterium]|nr:STAS domain-containing protein [Blastocatellia bacterium]
MQCVENRHESVIVVGLQGRMDSSTARIVEEKMISLIDRGESHLVVDCAQLDYISSAGLRVFLMAAKRLTQARGKLVLATMNDDVKQVFDMTGFSSIFKICGSKEEAINSYRQES